MGSITYDSLHFKTIGTDLTGAWERALRRAEDQQAAALILISDGGDNAGLDPAKAAAASTIPIYTVGIGDTAEIRDASISSLVCDDVAYQGKEVQLLARVKSRGLEGRPAALELTTDDGRILSRHDLSLPPDGLETEAILKFTPQQVGLLPLHLHLRSSDKEWSIQNNSRAWPLEVLESKIRVFVVSCTPSLESMFLQRAIKNLPDFELAAITFTRKEPVQLEAESIREAVAWADVLILMGLGRSTDLPALEMLGRFSAQHPAPVWFWSGGQLSPETSRKVMGDLPFSWSPRPSPGAAQVVPIRFYVELDPDAESSESDSWDDLPPITAPDISLILGPEAQTLLSFKDAETGADLGPALLVWENQDRRSAVSLGSGYWKWGFLSLGMGGNDQLYLNYLGRVLRWLAASPQSRPFKITTDRRLFSAGETVQFAGRVAGTDGRPISSAQVKIVLHGPEGADEILLDHDPATGYGGVFNPEAVGTYSYRGLALVEGDTLGSDSGTFIVEAYNVEKETLNQNRALLEAIAKASGGTYAPADSLAALIKTISAPPRTMIVGWTRRFFLNWDLWAILIGLLALEWIIRKRRGML